MVSPKTAAAKADSVATVADSLLVVSWNAAGFSRTHSLIQAHFGSLDAFLDSHQADIFCVQETRINASQLKSLADCQQLGAISAKGRYKSFWAFNEAGHYNGTATWIRKDLAPRARATQAVLRDDMDRDGRCLLVDLGGLAVFNVYAPLARLQENGAVNDAAVRQKNKFLHLLQGRIEETRRLGKKVLVCGDLNLTYRAVDVEPRWLRVKIDDEGCICGRKAWAVSDKSTKPSAGGPHIRVVDAAAELKVQLTMTVETAKRCLEVLHPSPEGLRVPSPVLPDLPLLPADRILVGIAKVEEDTGTKVNSNKEVRLWSSMTSATAQVDGTPMQLLAGLPEDQLILLEFGVPFKQLEAQGIPVHKANEPECVDWLSGLVGPSGNFVDTFAFCHEAAAGRFTYWNQTGNFRFCNSGARLDYILCDASMQQHLVRTPTSELAGSSAQHAAESAEAAWNAATFFGSWHNAPAQRVWDKEDKAVNGLGLQADNMRLNKSQFRPPHTGILYTPPRYSDHVPVCALFKGLCLDSQAVALTEAESKRTQPCSSQATLTNFFGIKKPRLS